MILGSWGGTTKVLNRGGAIKTGGGNVRKKIQKLQSP